MDDERPRPDQWAALLDEWPAAEPPADFADRVLAASATPPLERSAAPMPDPKLLAAPHGFGSLLILAALAAAAVLIPISLRHPLPPRAPVTLAASSSALDLGPQRD